MGDGGYGLTGAKREYTSGVRLGNWNEDRFGLEQSRQATSNVRFEGLSEAQRAFRAPEKQEGKAVPRGQDVAPVHPSMYSVPRHMLFGHGFDAHDPTNQSKDAFLSTTHATYRTAKEAVPVQRVIAGSKGSQGEAAKYGERRSEKTVERAKLLAAGIDAGDPRGAKSTLKPKPTPQALSGGGTFVTMSQLSARPIVQRANLTRTLGRRPTDTEERTHKPRSTNFSSQFKQTIPGLRR